MTTTDWIIDIALILVVFIQLHEQRVGIRTFLMPLAIMGWAVSSYLHGVPTAGNDILLFVTLTAAGVVFGLLSGLLSRVRYDAGKVYIKATLGAAAVWAISMGARMAFAVWTSHPAGAHDIGRFSVTHDITSGEAWVVALLLMAFAEVIVRLAVIAVRSQLVSKRAPEPLTVR
jgi:hypothetical protein